MTLNGLVKSLHCRCSHGAGTETGDKLEGLTLEAFTADNL